MEIPKEAASRLEPDSGIFVMENHDEAYRIWRDAGVRQKILVHIDAHDDLAWTPDQGPINIANFICKDRPTPKSATGELGNWTRPTAPLMAAAGSGITGTGATPRPSRSTGAP